MSISMNFAEGNCLFSEKEIIHYFHINRGWLYETMAPLELF